MPRFLQSTEFKVQSANKVARIRVRALFTGLLRYARNDKDVCGGDPASRFLQSAEFKVQSANDVSHTRQVLFTPRRCAAPLQRRGTGCGAFCHREGALRPWRSSHNKVARIRVRA